SFPRAALRRAFPQSTPQKGVFHYFFNHITRVALSSRHIAFRFCQKTDQLCQKSNRIFGMRNRLCQRGLFLQKTAACPRFAARCAQGESRAQGAPCARPHTAFSIEYMIPAARPAPSAPPL